MKRKLVILDEDSLAKSIAKYIVMHSRPIGQSEIIRYLIEQYASNDQWK